MIVGILVLELKLYESFSLKEKRKVLKALIERARRNFNISIAEVDHNDIHNYATIGITCVSNSRRFLDSVLDKFLEFCQSNFNIEIVNARRDFL